MYNLNRLRCKHSDILITSILTSNHNRGILKQVMRSRIDIHNKLEIPIILRSVQLPKHLQVNSLLGDLRGQFPTSIVVKG